MNLNCGSCLHGGSQQPGGSQPMQTDTKAGGSPGSDHSSWWWRGGTASAPWIGLGLGLGWVQTPGLTQVQQRALRPRTEHFLTKSELCWCDVRHCQQTKLTFPAGIMVLNKPTSPPSPKQIHDRVVQTQFLGNHKNISVTVGDQLQILIKVIK